jgi:hypothetical protein
VYRRRGRGLQGEPFLQAGAAEGVEAVEEGERLVEKVGTDLSMTALAGASSPLDGPQEPEKERPGHRELPIPRLHVGLAQVSSASVPFRPPR